MRNHMLRAAAGNVDGGFRFIGSATAEATSASTALSLDLTSLSAGSLQLGDIVVTGFTFKAATDQVITQPTGYTKLQDEFASATYDNNGAVAYKLQTGTVDTTITWNAASGAPPRAAIAMVFRGGDQSTPVQDSNGRNSTGTPNPGAVTVTGTDVICFVFAGQSYNTTSTDLSAPTNYEGIVNVTNASGIRAGAAYRLNVPAGTENPDNMGGSGDANTGYTAFNVALAPA